MELIERNTTDQLISRVERERIIVITGARQTGKTTLCEQILTAKLNQPHTYISFDDPDERLRFQNSGIAILESIDTPLVILDEVQKLPIVLEQLKFVVDKRQRESAPKSGLFLLTGSSHLTLLKNVKETLAGRVSIMHLYPFSLSEVLKTGKTSLLS
ncbi:MAG: AAA family ATPase, partial [Syntrophorhabdaceae bacterium]|nr:AAA family ATPase [Syntrophorhabdaceae bacterium]